MEGVESVLYRVTSNTWPCVSGNEDVYNAFNHISITDIQFVLNLPI